MCKNCKSITIPQGPKGDIGLTGANGANGTAGVNGKDGSTPFKYIQQFNVRIGFSTLFSIAESSIPFANFSNANITNTFSDISINFWVSLDGGTTWSPTYVGGTIITLVTFTSSGLTISSSGTISCAIRVIIMA